MHLFYILGGYSWDADNSRIANVKSLRWLSCGRCRLLSDRYRIECHNEKNIPGVVSALADLLLWFLVIVTDGGVMGMKSMPAMHNGVFQGDNFTPAAR